MPNPVITAAPLRGGRLQPIGKTAERVLNRLCQGAEVVPVFVEFEAAVPHLRPAGW
jgi:hypothetical protein